MPRVTRSSAKSPATNSRRVSRNTTAIHDESSGEEVEKKWDVRSIQAKQIDAKARVKYLIDWENWSGDPTWEPEENCQGCRGAIDAFERKIAKSRPGHSLSRTSERSMSPDRQRANTTKTKSRKSGGSSDELRLSSSSERSGSTDQYSSPAPALRSNAKSFKSTPDRAYRTRRSS